MFLRYVRVSVAFPQRKIVYRVYVLFLAPRFIQETFPLRFGRRNFSQGAFAQAIFSAIFVAIPNRPCKLAAISWRFVATKSSRFRTRSNFEAIYWPFFFSLRVTNRHEIAASLHGRFVHSLIVASKKSLFVGYCSEIAGNDHIVVCFFVASFVGAILLRRFFSSLVHEIDDTNLLKLPITMVKTREKATNDILQCIQPKPRFLEFLVVVANDPRHFDYRLRLLIGQPLPCNELHRVSRESTCDLAN